MTQVVALVEEDRAQLFRVQPPDERRRDADARADEPVAEGEGPLVVDHIDPPLEVHAGGGELDDPRDGHALREERANEPQRPVHLARQ
jgi:hypothetical protein